MLEPCMRRVKRRTSDEVLSLGLLVTSTLTAIEKYYITRILAVQTLEGQVTSIF